MSYNAKARQSTAGSRKKGKPKKVKREQGADPNALVYVPKTEEEKELDAREKLKKEVTVNPKCL